MPENCNPKDCPIGLRVDALDESVKKHREKINELEKTNAIQNVQYDAIMKTLENMDKKHDRLADKMESVERAVAGQSQAVIELNERGKKNQERLDALEAKPGKRWNDIVDKLIAGVVGAFATAIFGGIVYLLARIGG